MPAIDGQITLSPPFNRGSIRELARRYHEAAVATAKKGGNHYQLTLDQQDRVNAFAATLSEDDAVAFLTMYAEEVDALTKSLTDEAVALEAENARLAIPRAIGSAVTAAAILWILYMLIFMW